MSDIPTVVDTKRGGVHGWSPTTTTATRRLSELRAREGEREASRARSEPNPGRIGVLGNRYLMTKGEVPLMVRFLTAPPTLAPSVTDWADDTLSPMKRPFVILPLIDDVILPPTILVVVDAVKVDVALVFQVIVEVSFNGFVFLHPPGESIRSRTRIVLART